jgi:hypothetical protein
MRDRERLERLIRNFPENGLKVLLEHPANVHDLLQILQVRLVPRIDFGRMRVEPAHFVERDYSHLESDVVLQAPLRPARKGNRLTVTIYILIEHQSEPDRFMVFRVLEYVVQMYKRQLVTWLREHQDTDGFQFQPVLPIVLYSGTRTWTKLERLAALVAQAEGLEDVLPEFTPLFLNVGQTPGETLEQRGGPFGLLLRLVQRRLRRTVFEQTLQRVVRALAEQMADQDRDRWLGLLSYVTALIYHEREDPERGPLNQKVLDSVETDPHRAEVYDMGKTIAEALKEEGARNAEVLALRRTLLRQLHLKFKKVPEGVAKRVEATDNAEQLQTWLDAVIPAKKLADVGITPLE